MNSTFRFLQRKSLWRSQRVGTGVATRIMTGLFILYFGAIFLVMGLNFDKIIEEFDTTENPLQKLHQYLFYYLIFELVMRVVFQEVSEVKYRQLCLLPISKNSIIHHILKGTAISFFNVLPLFFMIPFAVKNLAPEYGWIAAICWLLAVCSLLLFNNYVALQIKHWIANNPLYYLIPAVSAGLIYVVDSQGWLEISSILDLGLMSILNYLVPLFIFLLLPIGAYKLVFKRMRTQAYITSNYQAPTSIFEKLNFNRLGDRGFFGKVAQTNLRLMFRNKRTRTQVILGTLFLLYGLYLYSNDRNGPTQLLFWGLYMTGIMVLSFAQYIWSYQGSYTELLWTLPIPIKKYINAQYDFLILASLATTLPSMLYYFMNPDVPKINAAAFLFNIGINIPILLAAASYNKKKLDINTAGTFNMQGVNGMQFVFIFTVLLAPIFLYLPFSIFNYAELGLAVIGGLGIIGILLKPLSVRGIASLFSDNKYGLTEGYRSN